MRNFEIMSLATRGITKTVAYDIHVSERFMNAGCHPKEPRYLVSGKLDPGNGQDSYLDRVEAVMRAVHKHGSERAALIAYQVLCIYLELEGKRIQEESALPIAHRVVKECGEGGAALLDESLPVQVKQKELMEARGSIDLALVWLGAHEGMTTALQAMGAIAA